MSTDGRWLVWDNLSAKWQVLERLPYAKKTTIVIETNDEDAAVKALLDEEDD